MSRTGGDNLFSCTLRRLWPPLRVAMVVCVLAASVKLQAAEGPGLVEPHDEHGSSVEDLPLGRIESTKASDIGQPAAGPRSSPYEGTLTKTSVALGVVLGLVFIIATAVARIGRRASHANLAAALGPGGSSPPGILEVLGRYSISRSQVLILLRVDQRVLLLAQTVSGGRRSQASLQTLSEITEASSVASIQRLVREHEAKRGEVLPFGSILRQLEPGGNVRDADVRMHTLLEHDVLQGNESAKSLRGRLTAARSTDSTRSGAKYVA
jgi:flagellar biogenesis protein FliO